MIFYRPKPRSFHYNPQYYKPEKDAKRRLTFERKTYYDPHHSGSSFVTLLLLLVVVTFLLIYIIPRLSSIKPEKTRIGSEDAIELAQEE